MFTQPLNYDFFTVPFLVWHPLSFSPTKYYIIYGNLRESEDSDEARPCIHFFFFFFPRGYFFVPRDDVVVLFAENSELESLKTVKFSVSVWIGDEKLYVHICYFRILGDFRNVHLYKILFVRLIHI